MSKLSKVQKEVLTHMAKGHKLCVPRGSTPWLAGVFVARGMVRRVHSNTVRALIVRGCIEKADTETTPWWRRDYVITEEGSAVLDEADLDEEEYG